MSRLKSERLVKETQINRLEMSLSEKADQVNELQRQLRQVRQSVHCVCFSYTDCITFLHLLLLNVKDTICNWFVMSVRPSVYLYSECVGKEPVGRAD